MKCRVLILLSLVMLLTACNKNETFEVADDGTKIQSNKEIATVTTTTPKIIYLD